MTQQRMIPFVGLVANIGTTQRMVPWGALVAPAAVGGSGTFAITLDDAVFAGSASSGSGSASFSITLDAAVFAGSASSAGAVASFTITTADAVFSGAATGSSAAGTITGDPLCNESGLLSGLLAHTNIPKVSFLRLSDMTPVLALVNQVTNGAGLLPITHAALVPGTTYLRVLAGADAGAATDSGCKAYVAS